jgi:Uma2 family endonuclease
MLTAPAKNSVILYNISWHTYQEILRDSAEQPNKRMTYDQGILEIITPLPEHETYKKILDRL